MTNLNKKIKENRGMTYIELIVVLSIFAIMSAVSMFNYRGFQAKIDIRNLASDIALQIVGAQKNSIAGTLKLPIGISLDPNWKPSYGVYFDRSKPKQFIYFSDLNNDKFYESGEELDTILITKGDFISYLETDCGGEITGDMNIVFTRPNSDAVITNNVVDCNVLNATIGISSSDEVVKTNIVVYPSGRIQIKNAD